LVVEKMKSSNRRRKNQIDPQQIDLMVPSPPSPIPLLLMLTMMMGMCQVETMLNRMADAVDADVRAYREKTPGVAKIKLLPEVVSMLHKYASFLYININMNYFLRIYFEIL
jgi:hypothetical protein